MLIPISQLDPLVLDSLLEDFVTRAGTDNGNLVETATPKAQLLAQLETEQAFITFNAEYQQPCIVARHDVPESAIAEYHELLASAAESEAIQKSMELESASLREKLVSTGMLPLVLENTTMSCGTAKLLDSGKITSEQINSMFDRHCAGDFGCIGLSDQLSNLKSIPSRDYVLSCYELGKYSFYIEMLYGWHEAMVMQVNER